MTGKRFVVVSGLPGSGKSTLARRLAPALNLPILDKDDILERLFDSKGTGGPEWRRALSRESDLLFKRQASASNGAILVSHWRLAGMPADSGTSTGWLDDISGTILHIRCVCDPDIAAERFIRRERHTGHTDSDRSPEAIRASILALARIEPLGLLPRIDIDTTGAVCLEEILTVCRAGRVTPSG